MALCHSRHMVPMLTVPFLLLAFALTSDGSFSQDDVKFVCAHGERPFVEVNGQFRICTDLLQCPIGYDCTANGICCTRSLQCPNGYTLANDRFGRIIFCTATDASECPSGSICMRASDATQQLCCTQTQRSYIVIQDVISAHANECSSSHCVSNSVDGRRACCSDSHRRPLTNHCPYGWSMSNAVLNLCDPSMQNACPGSASCLRSNLASEQFICCLPGERFSYHSAGLDGSLLGVNVRGMSCASTEASPEYLLDGKPRICIPFSGACSPGYSCEKSKGDTQMICCPTFLHDSKFQCALPMHTPALNAGQNMFCSTPGRTDQCPSGAVCQIATNSNLFICCYKTKYRRAEPQCPTSSVPQYNSIGLVFCDISSLARQCNPGYTCTHSISDISLAICCSVRSSSMPICPGQQELLMANNSPYYCTTNNELPCPPGYTCNEAQNQPGIHVCCTSRSSNSCPTNFTPSLNTAGRVVHCTPNQPNVCPGYSMCLQSTRSPNTFLCCQSKNLLHTCPNNGQALLLPNGRVEECGKPGASCSQKGYTCQLSSALSAWICCSQPSQIAICADGRKTYFEIEGQTFSCEPFAVPTACPPYYDCSVSNTSGVFVCCQQSVTSTTPAALKAVMGCPIGWNPFQSEIDGSFRFCLNSFDMRCPIGFSCTQSTHSGIYMCCRLASTIRCAHGQSMLLVNNQPKLCYGTQQNSCPIGYSCNLSTKIGIYICCSDYIAFQRSHFDVLKEIRCLSDSSMPAIHNDNIQYCIETNKSSSCPRGYLCSPSTVGGLNVCCKSLFGLNIRALESSLDKACGIFGVIYRRNGRVIECTDNMNLCPKDFSCQPSLVNAKMYCCQEPKCQTGLALSKGRLCEHSHDCPEGYECLQSTNVKDIRLCCATVNVSRTRCLERKTQLSAGKVIACTEDSHCADGYRCSTHTTSGEYTCCEELPYPTRICPQNREPYHGKGGDELVFCSMKRQHSCPSGYLCKRAVNSRHHICCSPIAFCPSRYVPLIDPETNQAKRCLSEASNSTSSSADCSPGYSCRQSSVPYLKVCCRAPSTGNHSGASVDDSNLEQYAVDGSRQ